MLFVTNGDSAAGAIRQAGSRGEVLPWRDVLHEGRGFVHRDATLAGFRDHEEVVLWFKHDLYDQSQLIQVLDRFAGVDLGSAVLTLVSVDEYLGR